jgi:hypothetical protein
MHRRRPATRDTLPAPGNAQSEPAPRPSLLLPKMVGISQAADAARHALCALLTMPTHPTDLEQWFAGPYREATRFTTGVLSVARRREDSSSILAAQRKAARVIYAASRGSDALVGELPAVVHIRPAHDRFGGRGFVPFDVPGNGLVGKAVALALADYFTRPDEFLSGEYEGAAAVLRRISGEICKVALSRDG